MATVFSKIINGEIPSYKIAENDKFLAFFDISPLQKGHTLVIPKLEEDYLFDLSDDILSEMMIFSKEVAKKIKKAIKCNRIGMSVIGLEVPHAHIHLIPINNMEDMMFTSSRLSLTNEEFSEIQTKIVNQ